MMHKSKAGKKMIATAKKKKAAPKKKRAKGGTPSMGARG